MVESQNDWKIGEGRLLEGLQKNDAQLSNRCRQACKDVSIEQRQNGGGPMIQAGKEGSRVFQIAGEAQKKNLTSFSIDAERVRGPG
jgi:hypothetical protein